MNKRRFLSKKFMDNGGRSFLLVLLTVLCFILLKFSNSLQKSVYLIFIYSLPVFNLIYTFALVLAIKGFKGKWYRNIGGNGIVALIFSLICNAVFYFFYEDFPLIALTYAITFIILIGMLLMNKFGRVPN